MKMLTMLKKKRKKSGSAKRAAKDKYVIVRAQEAGCFYGILVYKKGNEVKLKNSKRLWEWTGANTISDLAVLGTTIPESCLVPVAIPEHIVLGVCEIATVTPKALKSLNAIPQWVFR